jgi:hypothetical protein
MKALFIPTSAVLYQQLFDTKILSLFDTGAVQWGMRARQDQMKAARSIVARMAAKMRAQRDPGKGLHSSSSQLNVCAFCGTRGGRGMFRGCL